jgi:hypothetical protein
LIEAIVEDTSTSGGFLADDDFATAENPDVIERGWKDWREAGVSDDESSSVLIAMRPNIKWPDHRHTCA